MNKINFKIAYVDSPWCVFHISEHNEYNKRTKMRLEKIK